VLVCCVLCSIELALQYNLLQRILLMKMEFWGVEVKPGEVLCCDPGDDKYLHLSQAALGEIQIAKENERVLLNVHDDNKKIVLGALTYGKCDQFSLDIMFSKPFKLSHSCTTGSVFFIGYTTVVEDVDGGMGGYEDSDSDSDDDRQAQALMRRVKENGQKEARLAKPELMKDGVKQLKPESVLIDKAAAKAKPGERKSLPGKKPEEKEESSEDDDEEDDDDDDDVDDDDDEDDEGMEGSSDDEDESDEEEGDSDDESDEDKNRKMPKVESSGKKRPLPDSSIKSPGTDKKAKVTPGGAQNQGTDGGKKGGPKISVSKEQIPSNKGQTPKAKGGVGAKESPKPSTTPGSGKKIGQHVCNTCSRNFATESALTQHNAAKHGGK